MLGNNGELWIVTAAPRCCLFPNLFKLVFHISGCSYNFYFSFFTLLQSKFYRLLAKNDKTHKFFRLV